MNEVACADHGFVRAAQPERVEADPDREPAGAPAKAERQRDAVVGLTGQHKDRRSSPAP